MPLLSAAAFTLMTAWVATAWQAPVEIPKPPVATPTPISQFDRLQRYAQPAPRQIAQVQPAAPPAADQKSNPPDEKIMEMFVNGELKRYRATRIQLPDGRTMWGINERDGLIAQTQTPPNVLRAGHFEGEAERQALEREIKRQLETPYAKWLNEDVAYIITNEERAAFQSLQTDDERNQFVQQFWLRRDPTPGTPLNELQQEHYRRIDYANNHFSSPSGVPGWKTDRGRIYITFGPPNELDSHPTARDGKPPYETWRYRFIGGVGTDVTIEFVDTAGNGEYNMTMDPNNPANVLAPQPPR